MKTITLTQGKVALVDDEDFERINQFKWYYGEGYAIREIQTGVGRKARKTIRMHRMVTDTPEGMEVDHINHDKLDNRKTNLRVCNRLANGKNKMMSKRNKSGYKGVHARYGRWVAVIRFNWKLYHLGVFDTPEEAARAYNKAAVEYFGEYAYLNEGLNA